MVGSGTRTINKDKAIAQCQPDQLSGSVVSGKVPSDFDSLAQLTIDALARIGRVNYPAHFRRKCQQEDPQVSGVA